MAFTDCFCLVITEDNEALTVDEFVKHIADLHSNHTFSKEFEVLVILPF